MKKRDPNKLPNGNQKEPWELKNEKPDMRNVPINGMKARGRRDMSRINPIMNDKRLRGKQGGLRGLINRIGIEGKEVDDSQEAVNRAIDNYNAEQTIRKINRVRRHDLTRHDQRIIPITDETIKKYAQIEKAQRVHGKATKNN